MAGKRLLDLAALFNASRGVAQKHAALRSRQLELWGQTSSLAKAVKSQTDRVTETAKAASFLASRLNETAPPWTSEASQSNRDKPIPYRESTEGKSSQFHSKDSLEQDHFYDRSELNTSADPVPAEDLKVSQKKSDRFPLQDGTLPTASSRLNFPIRGQEVISQVPPAPLKDHLQESHDGEPDLRPVSSGESTIPIPSDSAQPSSSEYPHRLQRQHELQIPSQPADTTKEHSGHSLDRDRDEDVFYTPSKSTSPAVPSLPRVKIPKRTEEQQGDDVHIQNLGINSDSYSSTSAGGITVPQQEQVPEGINTDLFHSPRVGRMLSGKTHLEQKKDLDPKIRDGISRKQMDSSPDMKSGTYPVPASVAGEWTSGPSKDEEIAEVVEDIKGGTSRSSRSPAVVSSFAPYEMRESKVPSSRVGRLWSYSGLAAGMFGGAITESLRRATGSGGEGSYMLSAGNMDRLVAKLSQMRGAALKLGQMMSFQDSKLLPAPIQQILLRVQDSADYMPSSQRDRVLSSDLGPNWRDLFSTFEEKPMAAASIGQVHSATLKSNGHHVAVKVQYPGVASSIDSDLSNLAVLLTASRLLPKGLFLEKTITNAKTELAWECDYVREAKCGKRFQELLYDEKDVFTVPKIYPEASGKKVLTMEYMDGVGVTKFQNFNQEQKDWIGTQILRLCLREITEFRFMQTDPNWTNFLYNAATRKLELLDFGASREYPEEFISRYTRLLLAASKSDEDTVRKLSIELGYLTGHESKAMLNAHIASVLTLAEPFLVSSPETYDFRDQTITERVKALIPVMVRERLAPPPEETYSLHRKLSGAFLLCARLGSRVRCRELFENSMKKAELE